jgi:hypothetical protein
VQVVVLEAFIGRPHVHLQSQSRAVANCFHCLIGRPCGSASKTWTQT